MAREPADGDGGADERHRLAVELSSMVELWRRLLSRHRPDGTGHCRSCTRGGTGLPGARWPCTIHGIAELARRHHERTRTVARDTASG